MPVVPAGAGGMSGPSTFDKWKMGAMMGGTVGLIIGFIFGATNIIRYGAGSNGVMRSLGQYMAGSAATFGFFMSIGTVIRTDTSSEAMKYFEGAQRRAMLSHSSPVRSHPKEHLNSAPPRSMPRPPTCPYQLRLGYLFAPRKTPRTSHRPPDDTTKPFARRAVRFFSGNAPLRTLHRPTTRPQLPFLYQTLHRRHNARLLTTGVMANIRYQLKLGLYWAVIGWTIIGGCFVFYYVLREDWLDKVHPAPKEWSFMTKHNWRSGKHLELVDGPQSGHMQWTNIGENYRAIAMRLERGDDNGLVHQQDWDSTIPGLDPDIMHQPTPSILSHEGWQTHIGWDITAKSEHWRRGYYETMMGLAQAAEMRADYFTRMSDKMVLPRHCIRSEDNPDPTPIPGKATPDMSECVSTIEPANVHYIRILSTKGFSRKQRLDAGVAYARWLDHGGNASLAEALYRWSLNIAADGIAAEIDSNDDGHPFVDVKTGVLQSNAPFTTPNLLKTTTSLASHLAHHGNISSALAIYLSILRARRAAPDAPPTEQYPHRTPNYGLESVNSWAKFIMDLPTRGIFPDVRRSGDEPFEKRQGDKCDEAELMAYVGEILFAKGGKKKQGLGWTREATELAQRGATDGRLAREAKQTCEECLLTLLENWRSMARSLAVEKSAADRKRVEKGMLSWIWQIGGPDRWVTDGEWVEEEDLIGARLEDLEGQMMKTRLQKSVRFNQNSWATAG
ncbi:MAG: hypothetical protein M1828_001979 [Chrysothrix sp. TS-e1954]|nr:MAG: hypothetical protein M1828_001979 [Chrysothrix sp. TS-e1954]